MLSEIERVLCQLQVAHPRLFVVHPGFIGRGGLLSAGQMEQGIVPVQDWSSTVWIVLLTTMGMRVSCVQSSDNAHEKPNRDRASGTGI
jgi:hypothetical protein